MARLGRTVRPLLFGLVTAALAGSLTAVVAPLAAAPVAAPARAATTYGAPSWWNGDCDTVNWTAKARAAGWTGEPARRLGGEVLGIPVCGPRNLAGGPNIWWSRPGWGELEWQCVEFAQRFMIQVYGTQPYQANGVDVVRNYTSARGGGLVRVDNGTVGTAPAPGDIVSFSSPSNVNGHVAVVASTSIDGNGNGSVRLATQNDTTDGWRTLAVTNWSMAAFGSLYPYAWLHDPQGRGGGGNVTPVEYDDPVADGTFVSSANVTYRVVGGAPLVVTSDTAVGGTPTQVVALSAGRFTALRTVPRDGTFLRDFGSGTRWVVVGGAALPVADCNAAGMNGCPGMIDIDRAAVTGAGGAGPYAHLLATIADGTFVRIDGGGTAADTVARAAGGALMPITDCADLGGCGALVDLPAATVAAYRSAHPTPADGTVVRMQPSGRFASWTAGRCTAAAAAPAVWTDVTDDAANCGAALLAPAG